MQPRHATLIKRIAAILVAVGALNFVAFLIHSTQIGGSALNGQIRDDHYFVSEHGKSQEVPEPTFKRMRFHERTVFITHPLAMIGMLLWAASSTKPPKINPNRTT